MQICKLIRFSSHLADHVVARRDTEAVIPGSRVNSSDLAISQTLDHVEEVLTVKWRMMIELRDELIDLNDFAIRPELLKH